MGRCFLGPRLAALIGLFGLSARGSSDGTVTGLVNVFTATPAGAPAPKADASGVVVYITGFPQPAPREIPRMAQKNKTFIPNVLPIVVGQTVEFTNEDNIVHNVFSTSKARPFDLGKPRVGESRRVSFDRTGLVEIYCDIHEQMAATILVLPNRAFAVTGPDGKFALEGIPPGQFTLYAWNPQSEPVQRPIEIRPGRNTEVTLELTETKFDKHHLGKYGQPYGKPVDYSNR